MTSRRLGWGVLLAVLVGGAPAPAATPDDAQRAYAAGRFEEARRLWEPRAEAGDAEAQFGLGLLFDIGQGVAQDPASAYRWYRRAAEAGMAEAQFNVAVMHDTGEGRPRDPAAAALWYSRAAAHGNRRAQFNLAQLYAAGQGLPRNLDQAEVWYEAAASSVPAAADKLAALRRSGRPGGPARVGALPVQPQPTAPPDGSSVRRPAGPAAVELVWNAPAQPVQARFFVQLLAFDVTGPREVFAAYLDESAALAPLDRVPGRYAWRVYAVNRDFTHYAASAWNSFSVQVADVAEQPPSAAPP